MEQDFTKGLNVCIGNYGYYNEGSLHDAWITLPKTEAEIRDFLHLNHLQDRFLMWGNLNVDMSDLQSMTTRTGGTMIPLGR